jgi:transcription termination factor 2
MLLSLAAGGVGLHLVAANHVVLVDPAFNPSLEDQAADRVYRVGQKRDVHIHSLFCTDTIEEHVRQIQAGKRRMAKGIMNTAHIEKDSDALRDIFLDMLASS